MEKEGVYIHLLKVLHHKIVHLSKVYETLDPVPSSFSKSLDYSFVLHGKPILEVKLTDKLVLSYFDPLLYFAEHESILELCSDALGVEVAEHHRFKKLRHTGEFHTTAQVDLGKLLNLGNYVLNLVHQLSPAYSDVKGVKEIHGNVHTWRIYVHGKHGKESLLEFDLTDHHLHVIYGDNHVEEAVHGLLHVQLPQLFSKRRIMYESSVA